MCGILGYVAVSKNRPDVEIFKKSLKICSTRGTHATGFYTPDIGIHKKDISAEKFVNEFDKQLIDGIKSNVLIAHCRAVTKGPAKNNVNNHPHESENFVLVHNGSITRTDQIDEYEYKSECDSENILAYVETYGVQKGLENMIETDGQAIALYDKKLKKLWLFRNNNPTVMLLDKKDKILYFGSSFDIIKPFYRYSMSLGFTTWDNMSSFETSKNLLYLISPEKGLEKKIEIKQKTYVYKHTQESSAYSQGYSGYQNNRSSYGGNKGQEWCDECHKLVDNIHNHQCKNKGGIITKTTPKVSKRQVIYKGGTVKYITEKESESIIIL